MATKYTPGGVTVTIGRSQDVSLPPVVRRGRATCMHFDTDKSFLLPPSVPGVRNIVTFFQQHPGATMLVNGHTDLVGDAQYNLQLSSERAAAVAAYLRNTVDDWLAWYSAPAPSKRWSYTEDQHMLATVVDASGAAYYAGPITGLNDAATQDATGRFQGDVGLPADKQLGPDTRRKLVERYMQLEGTSLPDGTPLVLHGCGKFHPVDPTLAADEGNRRVEIFLFDGAVDPAPQNPCPAPGCAQYPQWVGLASTDVDLCQPAPVNAQLRIRLIDADEQPRAGVDYQLKVGGQLLTGTTKTDGMIVQDVPAGVTEAELTWDDFTRKVQIEVLADAGQPAGAQARLRNLGFGALDAIAGVLDELTRLAVTRFQTRHALEVTGELDDPTAAKLKECHDA